MKREARSWILFVTSLPGVVVGYAWLLLLCLLFVAEWRSLMFQGAGVLVARTRPKAARFWGFSTTVGRAILYHPNIYDGTRELENRVERHEFVHIRQFEDDLLRSLLTALVIWFATGSAWSLLLWPAGLLAMVPNFITAVLRFGWKGIYRDTEHERSAYAQTDIVYVAGKGWDELREEERARQEGLL